MTEGLNADSFKYDLSSIGKYSEHIKLDEKSKSQIISVFKECDTEDAKGNKVNGGDGQLNNREQRAFKDLLKERCLDLYEKFSQFFSHADEEELQKARYYSALGVVENIVPQPAVVDDKGNQVTPKTVIEDIKNAVEQGSSLNMGDIETKLKAFAALGQLDLQSFETELNNINGLNPTDKQKIMDFLYNLANKGSNYNPEEVLEQQYHKDI